MNQILKTDHYLAGSKLLCSYVAIAKCLQLNNDECLNKATNVTGLQKLGISTQIYTRLKKLVYFLVTVYDKYVL